MGKKLYEDIKATLAQESDERLVRVSAVLRGANAQAFIRIHQDLGGPDSLSRNDLASRILAHALEGNDAVRRERKATEQHPAG
jgi:hypothetical protein